MSAKGVAKGTLAFISRAVGNKMLIELKCQKAQGSSGNGGVSWQEVVSSDASTRQFIDAFYQLFITKLYCAKATTKNVP